MAKNHYNRKQAWLKFHHLYRPSGHDSAKCVYCGDPADSKDHVPALAHVLRIGAEPFRRHKIAFLLYPCCRDCNSRLLDCEMLNIEKRARVLASKLDHRLKDIKCPEWEDDELAELGPSLRRYISNYETVRSWLERRLSFLESMGYSSYIEMNDPSANIGAGLPYSRSQANHERVIYCWRR